jgi:hypothetical protein
MTKFKQELPYAKSELKEIELHNAEYMIQRSAIRINVTVLDLNWSFRIERTGGGISLRDGHFRTAVEFVIRDPKNDSVYKGIHEHEEIDLPKIVHRLGVPDTDKEVAILFGPNTQQELTIRLEKDGIRIRESSKSGIKLRILD